MKTYTGGCHCQNVRYEVDLENLEGVISCNCSMCAKRGWILAFAPTSAFRLISGEDALTDYTFNSRKIHHLFCTTCGVASFGKGSDSDGNEMISINVRCLEDVDIESLSVTPYNGKDV